MKMTEDLFNKVAIYIKGSHKFNIETEQKVPVSISFTVDAITGPALRMYPLHQTVSVGSSCDIYIYIEEVENLVGIELDVSYNTAVISQIEITNLENKTSIVNSNLLIWSEKVYLA